MMNQKAMKWLLGILALTTVLVTGYNFTVGRELMAMQNKVTVERQAVKAIKVRRNGQGSVGQEMATPTILAEARGSGLTAVPEVDRLELLRTVAGESDVEIVNLLENVSNGRLGAGSSYHLGVRADMAKLIAFLQILEQKGLKRVVIDRVAAKRRGDIWDTNLEVTSYFRPERVSRSR